MISFHSLGIAGIHRFFFFGFCPHLFPFLPIHLIFSHSSPCVICLVFHPRVTIPKFALCGYPSFKKWAWHRKRKRVLLKGAIDYTHGCIHTIVHLVLVLAHFLDRTRTDCLTRGNHLICVHMSASILSCQCPSPRQKKDCLPDCLGVNSFPSMKTMSPRRFVCCKSPDIFDKLICLYGWIACPHGWPVHVHLYLMRMSMTPFFSYAWLSDRLTD